MEDVCAYVYTYEVTGISHVTSSAAHIRRHQLEIAMAVFAYRANQPKLYKIASRKLQI